MRNLRLVSLMVLIVALILSCAQIGNSFQHSNNVIHPGGSFINKVPPERVLLGIPLIYEQRRGLARDLGINPYNVMGNRNDYMYRDHHPLEDSPRYHEMGFKPFTPIHRIMKRGIIWNKYKKIKKGIKSVKKKVWKIKEKAVSIIKGPKSTVRPSYASTGGSWGYSDLRSSKASYTPAGNPSGHSGSGYGRVRTTRAPYGVSMPLGESSPSTRGFFRSPRSSYSLTSINGMPYFEGPNYKGMAVRPRL